MKINSSLFSVKNKIEVKSENLVKNLSSIYEQNFKIFQQIFLNFLYDHTKLKYSYNRPIRLKLISTHNAPDINIEIDFLSPFTVDVRMYYKDNNYENITYIYNVTIRLFLDAKLLEVKETVLDHSSYGKIQEPDKDLLKKPINSMSIQDKLTKNLLVNEWLNKLVALEYSLDKNQ